MKKKEFFPAPLIPAVAAVFYELMLHIWVTGAVRLPRLGAVAAFALGFGLLLGLIVSLVPEKGRRGVALALTAVLAALYLLEYFLNDAYQTFMVPATLLKGAAGVASDFADIVAKLLLRNLWRIGLFLLPVIACLLCRPGKSGWRSRTALALGALTGYLLGFAIVFGSAADAARLGSAYQFDGAVRSFGLNMALTLDVFQSKSGDETPRFDIPETQPAETAPPATQAPTQPTQPEETQAPTEPPVVYEPQVLPIDFGALAQSEEKTSVAAIHEYVASLTPSMENEYTGLFAGKNLIFITAESFTAEVIDPELTPTLYRLATEGIEFTDYYQPMWGGSTTSGEYANLIGLVPADQSKSMQEASQQDLFLTIGNRLRAQGYFSAAYHNHTYTYYDRDTTHPLLGYDTYMGLGNGMEQGVKKRWPESDLEMMEFTVPMYIDRQPFSIYYMTVSGHCLYTRSGNAMADRHYDKVSHLEVPSRVKGYLACNLELEYAMAHLVEQLEAAGIADDTVIVLATDHYPYGLENSDTWANDRDYLRELYGYPAYTVTARDHSDLIIWSGCIEDLDLRVDTPVYSLDILPTLSNLFDVEYDSRLLVGRDVFSDAQSLVLWPDFSWKTEKGTYLARDGVFTPAEGAEIEEGYVQNITAQVKNKITYSYSVSQRDYLNYVSQALPGQ